jgi:hypothetical protein
MIKYEWREGRLSSIVLGWYLLIYRDFKFFKADK